MAGDGTNMHGLRRMVAGISLSLITLVSLPSIAQDMDAAKFLNGIGKMIQQNQQAQVGAVSNQNLGEQTTTPSSADIRFVRPPRECVKDYSPTTKARKLWELAGEMSTPGSTVYKSSDILAAATAAREDVCIQILNQEKRNSANPNNCIIANAEQVKTLSWHDPQFAIQKSIIAQCIASLTGEDVISGSPSFNKRYAQIVSQERSNAAEKVIQDKGTAEAGRLAATVRNFDIKGISLAWTKQQLLTTGEKQGAYTWTCETDKGDSASDICTLPLEGKHCLPQAYRVPALGGGFNEVVGTKCDPTFPDQAKVNTALQKILTVGGKKVSSIDANFYNGKLAGVLFRVTPKFDSDSYAGLTQKYGPHLTQSPQKTTWAGQDETLIVTDFSIELRRPSLLNARELKLRNSQQAAEAERIRKATADANKKKADF